MVWVVGDFRNACFHQGQDYRTIAPQFATFPPRFLWLSKYNWIFGLISLWSRVPTAKLCIIRLTVECICTSDPPSFNAACRFQCRLPSICWCQWICFINCSSFLILKIILYIWLLDYRPRAPSSGWWRLWSCPRCLAFLCWCLQSVLTWQCILLEQRAPLCR